MKYPIFLVPLLLAACESKDLREFAKDVLATPGAQQVSQAENTMLNQAKQAEDAGNYGLALTLYKQLLDKTPTNITYAYGLAESLRRTGDSAGAIKIYSQIIAAKPEMVEAYEGKGLAELAKADTEAASYSFAEVMKRDPGRWRSLNAVGVLFAGKKMYPEARQYFVTALSRAPNNATVLNNMGLVFALEKDFFSAQTNLQKASELATSKLQQQRIELNTALVYASSGDIKNAETLARKHLDGAQLSNNLGLYAHLAKDDVLAKSYLNMALTESKVYYEKAWDNLQAVQAPKAENATETKIISQ